MNKRLVKFITNRLRRAEEKYLKSFGWSQRGFSWFPPHNYIFSNKRNQAYVLGHAVNSQKLASTKTK